MNRSGYYRERDKQRSDRGKALLDQLKDVPCMDCGNRFPPECMDFDHREGEVKVNNVGTIRHHSVDRLLAEVAKCDIVCANCHRIRTRRRSEQPHLQA